MTQTPDDRGNERRKQRIGLLILAAAVLSSVVSYVSATSASAWISDDWPTVLGAVALALVIITRHKTRR